MVNNATQPHSMMWRLQQGLCFYCQIDLVAPLPNNWNGHHPHLATVDHKHPRSEGGKRHRDNTVLACQRCNIIRGTLPFKEWMAILPSLRRHGMLEPLQSMKGVRPYKDWKPATKRKFLDEHTDYYSRTDEGRKPHGVRVLQGEDCQVPSDVRHLD